jgi:hypothetical protein
MFWKILVLGSFVSKGLYMILYALVALLYSIYGWIACFDQLGSKTFLSS